MDPVFTLQWPEFVVAQKLQRLLPRRDGYSTLIPLSRQEKGIDIVVLRRCGKIKSNATTIQVKASRTYLHGPPKRKDAPRYRYTSWYRRFDVPDRADFVILFGMYAPELEKTTQVSANWYRDCSLLFTAEEMRTFLDGCKTVGGKPDQMFGFAFDDLSKIVLSRGKREKEKLDFSDHLLEQRITELKRHLEPPEEGSRRAPIPNP